MSAHRFWRISVRGGPSGFALSELTLAKNGVPVPGAVTASESPVAGSLADLSDGVFGAAVVFTGPTVMFFFDCGTEAEPGSFIIGSGESAASFPTAYGLDWSDDGVSFMPQDNFYGVSFPGPYAAVPQVNGNAWSSKFTYLAASRIDADDPSIAFPVSYAVVAAPVDRGVRQVEFEWLTMFGTDQYTGWGSDAYVVNSFPSVPGQTADSSSYRAGDGVRYGGNTSTPYGEPYGVGDTIGMVVDFDARTIEMFKNGVSQGIFEPVLWNGSIYPVIFNTGSSSTSCKLRLGGFKYPVAGASDWAPIIEPKSLGYEALTVETAREARPEAAHAAYSGARQVSVMTQSGQPFGTDYGAAFIANTVKKKSDPDNLPLHRMVRCYRERDGLKVGETWSDALTGNYRFDWLVPYERYSVVSYDYEHNYRAVIADNLTPSAAP